MASLKGFHGLNECRYAYEICPKNGTFGRTSAQLATQLVFGRLSGDEKVASYDPHAFKKSVT